MYRKRVMTYFLSTLCLLLVAGSVLFLLPPSPDELSVWDTLFTPSSPSSSLPSFSPVTPAPEPAPAPSTPSFIPGNYIVVLKAPPLLAISAPTSPSSSVSLLAISAPTSPSSSTLNVASSLPTRDSLRMIQEDVLNDALGAAPAGVALSPPPLLAQYTDTLNGFAVALDSTTLTALASDPRVAGIYPDELPSPNGVSFTATPFPSSNSVGNVGITDGFLDMLHVREVWNMTNASGVPLTGRGMRLGVLTQHGVNYSEQGFGSPCTRDQFAAGTCAKFKGGWDSTNNDPDPYDDLNSYHGTLVSLLASANVNSSTPVYNRHNGTAPDVVLSVYRAGGGLSVSLAALEKIAQDKPPVVLVDHHYHRSGSSSHCAIYYTWQTDYCDRHPFAQSIATLSSSLNITFVGGTGNEYQDAPLFGSPESNPAFISVGASTTPRMTRGEVRFNNRSLFTGYVRYDSPSFSTEEANVIALVNALNTTGMVRWFDSGSLAQSIAGAGPLTGVVALVQTSASVTPESQVALFPAEIGGVVFYSHLPGAGPSYRLSSSESSFEGIISQRDTPVAYISYEEGMYWKGKLDAGTSIQGSIKLRHDPYQLARFSSRGPVPLSTGETVIGPTVVAQGREVCIQYGCFSGTSYSSPLVAGIVVLMKQAHPDWTPQQIKETLQATATDFQHPRILQGAGMVNAHAAVSAPVPLSYNNTASFPAEQVRINRTWTDYENATRPLLYASLSYLDRDAGIRSGTVTLSTSAGSVLETKAITYGQPFVYFEQVAPSTSYTLQVQTRQYETNTLFISTPLSATVPVFVPSDPYNEKVLCVYNSNSQLSKDVCDYYLMKRPGAKILGLNLPDNLFLDGAVRENMNSDTFLRLVAHPISVAVKNNVGWNITHLAIAKDLPIRVHISDGIVSANHLLSIESDSYAEGKFAGQIPTTDLNMSYYTLSSSPFVPPHYRAQGYNASYRFAVSHLTGYTLIDITKMIDRAQGEAPNLSQSYWLLDRDTDGFSVREGFIVSMRDKLLSRGVNTTNILRETTDQFPLSFPQYPLVGYFGPGTHHSNYPSGWIASHPAIRAPVLNRSILTSIESFNAYSVTGSASTAHDAGQGKLVDAFTANTFGGSQYSNAFAGAFGNVDEPTLGGILAPSIFFTRYVSGLTFAESFLSSVGHHDFGEGFFSSTGYLTKSIAIGDPLMRITDEPGLSLGALCSTNSDCRSNSCGIDFQGIPRCKIDSMSCSYNFEGSSVRSGRNTCVNTTTLQQCVNGLWAVPTSCSPHQECLSKEANVLKESYEGECLTSFGGLCTSNSECASNICTPDLQGIPRCGFPGSLYCIQGNRTVGTNTMNNSFACFTDTARKQCVNGLWSSPLSCNGGCSNGLCSEHVPYNVTNMSFTFMESGYYSITIPHNVTNMSFRSLFENPANGLRLRFYNASANTYLSLRYNPFFGGWIGVQEYYLSPGEGFMVGLLDGGYQINLSGQPYSAPYPLSLHVGINLVGFPYCATQYKSSDWLTQLTEQGFNCSVVSQVDVYKGPPQWYSFNTTLTRFGVKRDFNLTSWEAYELICQNVSSGGLWTPSCNVDNLVPVCTPGATLPCPALAGARIVSGVNNTCNAQGQWTNVSTCRYMYAGEVFLSNLTRVYTGTPQSASVRTVPAGLNVSVTYAGLTTFPTRGGSYPLVATIVNETYEGTVTATFTITPAPQTLSVPDFDTRMVFGEMVVQGSTNAGFAPTFEVISGGETFEVATGGAGITGITGQVIEEGTVRNGLFTRLWEWLKAYFGYATENTFAPTLSPSTLANGTRIMFVQPGTLVLRAIHPGNENYSAPVSVERTITVSPAITAITLGPVSDLTQTYNGTVKSVRVNALRSNGTSFTPLPSSLYQIHYNGFSNLPFNAGTYNVTAILLDPLSTLLSNPHIGILTITQADQSISYAPVPSTDVGQTVALSATASSGLPVTFSVTNGPATLAGNQLTVTGPGTIFLTITQVGNGNYRPATLELTLNGQCPTGQVPDGGICKSVCTSFTYSDFGVCGENGQQNRSILTAVPAGCVQGTPSLTQSCTRVCTPDAVGVCDAIGNATSTGSLYQCNAFGTAFSASNTCSYTCNTGFVNTNTSSSPVCMQQICTPQAETPCPALVHASVVGYAQKCNALGAGYILNGTTIETTCRYTCDTRYASNGTACIPRVTTFTRNHSLIQADSTGLFVAPNATNASYLILPVGFSQTRLTNLSLTIEDPTDDEAYLIVQNLSLETEETKMVVIKAKRSRSNAVCIADRASVRTKQHITDNCDILACPGTLGNYSCEVVGRSFIVSGLRHSGVIEERITNVSSPSVPSTQPAPDSPSPNTQGTHQSGVASSSSSSFALDPLTPGQTGSGIAGNDAPLILEDKEDDPSVVTRLAEALAGGNRTLLYVELGTFILIVFLLIVIFFSWGHFNRQSSEARTI
jgi:hypothetical protein